ncbi:DUF2310 family Zn-ribbon-containing protein [Echinicola shivajiensis]|uniref:DUF2310 family Zn-ribbon-containing protein n=1 Tax=Echinicola shivajiensis TaxID=1035916 RepID=UPI001BFC1A99|nr:DUF2310 family Zn-ribbon-containing protein [Echinicola shivajiensis]
MNSDKPIAAKIAMSLKNKGESGEVFIGLFGTLYQNNLIFSEPRELRRFDNCLEFTVIFRSRDAFNNWISHPIVSEYWSTKFESLLVSFPSTIEETDVIIEVDKVENCDCKASKFYILQGRSLKFMDELTCGSCLKQVPYSTLPREINIEEWQNYHQRFYLNWLESGVFEQDALAELTNFKESKLNKEGERIRRELTNFFKIPVYLNYFTVDPDEHHSCPICGDQGCESGLNRPRRLCKKCNTIFN